MLSLSKNIFKAYDIRGIVGKNLDAAIAQQIGLAFGKTVLAKKEQVVVIGRDGRLSSSALSGALALGLQQAGVDVIDLGMVTTPMLYFATHTLDAQSGVMVTGSHNPPAYNGFKLVLSREALYGDAIGQLYHLIQKNESTHFPWGEYRRHDINSTYLDRIIRGITLARPLKIAIDCGNGVAGAFAGKIYRGLGCEVTELFSEVDGTFPNHHPDPADPENLQDLISCLKNSEAEIGLAFDGDGDRLGVVTKDGQIIYPDRQLMLFAEDVLKRHHGEPILYDVKCTGQLAPWIKKFGGQPLMWKTGHSLIKAKMRETGAPLGGEMSGHLFFKDRWYGFDDGIYAGARLLELLGRYTNPSAVLNALPQTINTPELQVTLPDGENFSLVSRLQKESKFPDAQEISTIDGLRVEYQHGFGLIRASNTTPSLVMRFEADSIPNLKQIQGDFKRVIRQIQNDIILPF